MLLCILARNLSSWGSAGACAKCRYNRFDLSLWSNSDDQNISNTPSLNIFFRWPLRDTPSREEYVLSASIRTRFVPGPLSRDRISSRPFSKPLEPCKKCMDEVPAQKYHAIQACEISLLYNKIWNRSKCYATSIGDDGSDSESNISCFFCNKKIKKFLGRAQLLTRNRSEPYHYDITQNQLYSGKTPNQSTHHASFTGCFGEVG